MLDLGEENGKVGMERARNGKGIKRRETKGRRRIEFGGMGVCVEDRRP